MAAALGEGGGSPAAFVDEVAAGAVGEEETDHGLLAGGGGEHERGGASQARHLRVDARAEVEEEIGDGDVAVERGDREGANSPGQGQSAPTGTSGGPGGPVPLQTRAMRCLGGGNGSLGETMAAG